MTNTSDFDSIVPLVNEIRKQVTKTKNSPSHPSCNPTSDELRKIVSTAGKIDFFMIKGFKKDT